MVHGRVAGLAGQSPGPLSLNDGHLRLRRRMICLRANNGGMRMLISAGCALFVAGGLLSGSPASASPRLSWEPCPTEGAPTKQCALLTVPRDYNRPNGPTVQVGLARIPATGAPGQRIGSLLWDAGGPGGVSTDIVDSIWSRMSPRVKQRFDFVAFDPRGIGSSRPALPDCGSLWPVRPALDPLPNWSRVVDRSASQLAANNRACVKSRPRLAQSMGTNNVVRDLDRLRAALGDSQLTFWATSYGTRIGYVYALRYPQRVRALVMDGNLDPSAGYETLPRIGGTSADSALRFIRNNMRPLYRSVIATTASLTAAPVDLGDGTRFTRWNWLDLMTNIAAFQDAWPNITAAARLVDQARIPGEEGQQARDTLSRVANSPNSNEGGGFSIVNCLDYSDWLTTRQQVRVTTRNAQRSPLTGGSLTAQYAIGCAGLDALEPDPIPQVTTAAQRQRLARVPALLANSTHDGSTPMAWARRMQQAFDAPMIAYRSGQHVIWGAVDSECVNRPIDRFVLDLRMPRKSRVCAFVPPSN